MTPTLNTVTRRLAAAASILTVRGARVVVGSDSHAEQAAASGLPLITASSGARGRWHEPARQSARPGR